MKTPQLPAGDGQGMGAQRTRETKRGPTPAMVNLFAISIAGQEKECQNVKSKPGADG